MEEDDDERLEAEAAAAAAEYSALLASAAAGGDGLAERNAPIQYCCDVCGVCPIVGARWHCALCRDFDVCEQCHDGNEEEIGEIHDASHPLERREIRRRRPPTTGGGGVGGVGRRAGGGGGARLAGGGGFGERG